VNARRGIALACALAGAACLWQAAWIHVKAQLAQVLIAHAWQRHEHGDAMARPWPWADTTPVARLVVTGAGDQVYYVLEGSSGRNLAFGPTHDPASVLPGEPGNSVISGHRDTSFRFLESLGAGDRLRVDRNGTSTWFTVTDARVVDSRVKRIALGSAVPRLTLVTCYPFAAVLPGGPLRWVVTATATAADHSPPARAP
jgi:sortase A